MDAQWKAQGGMIKDILEQSHLIYIPRRQILIPPPVEGSKNHLESSQGESKFVKWHDVKQF